MPVFEFFKDIYMYILKKYLYAYPLRKRYISTFTSDRIKDPSLLVTQYLTRACYALCVHQALGLPKLVVLCVYIKLSLAACIWFMCNLDKITRRLQCSTRCTFEIFASQCTMFFTQETFQITADALHVFTFWVRKQQDCANTDMSPSNDRAANSISLCSMITLITQHRKLHIHDITQNKHCSDHHNLIITSL